MSVRVLRVHTHSDLQSNRRACLFAVFALCPSSTVCGCGVDMLCCFFSELSLFSTGCALALLLSANYVWWKYWGLKWHNCWL